MKMKFVLKHGLSLFLLILFTNPLFSQEPCPEYNEMLSEAKAMEQTSMTKAIRLYEEAKICYPAQAIEIDEMIIKVRRKREERREAEMAARKKKEEEARRRKEEEAKRRKAEAMAKAKAEARKRAEEEQKKKMIGSIGIKPTGNLGKYKFMPKFPFPPPKASASHIFDNDLFAGITNLTESSKRIEKALKKSGYYEKSYYQIPNGYALVTRIEKMEADGTPAAEEERWTVGDTGSSGSFDLLSYFKSLFYANDGHYRIIVFLVTADDVQMSNKVMLMSEGQGFLSSGLNRLPSAFDSMPFTENHYCTALIYEWYKIEHEEAKFMQPSKFLGQYHLAKNKFVEYLEAEKKR